MPEKWAKLCTPAILCTDFYYRLRHSIIDTGSVDRLIISELIMNFAFSAHALSAFFDAVGWVAGRASSQ